MTDYPVLNAKVLFFKEISMATFILIHGAWHGGWCWERIVPLLEHQGHHVLAPDLPGMGSDRRPLSSITLDYWAQFVADLARQQKETVILVGHSRGGIVISQAAEYARQYTRALIYLSAFLIPNGGTLRETVRQHPQSVDPQNKYVLSADKTISTVIPAAVADIFYNTTSESWIKHAASLLCPEPMMVSSTPLSLTPENFGSLPRFYIECLQDKAVPITLQRSMVTTLPCQKVLALDTDHSPFYSEPELLVAQLLDLEEFCPR